MQKCVYCKNVIRTMGYKATEAGGYICSDCYTLLPLDMQKRIDKLPYNEISDFMEKKELEIGENNRIEFYKDYDKVKKSVRKRTRIALLVSTFFVVLFFALKVTGNI